MTSTESTPQITRKIGNIWAVLLILGLAVTILIAWWFMRTSSQTPDAAPAPIEHLENEEETDI